MKPLRILVADDHEVVRRGVRALLEARPGWEICGEAADGREAVALAEQSRPDVAILDIGMPGLNGLDASRQIQKLLPRIEVLILTMHESEQVVQEVMAAGARGYVLKYDAGRDLVAAVEALGNHTAYFSPAVPENLQKAHPGNGNHLEARKASLVTLREREVIQLLAEGKGNKEVAGILGISVRTAETHRANIMRKLEFHSLSDLVRFAIRNKIVNP